MGDPVINYDTLNLSGFTFKKEGASIMVWRPGEFTATLFPPDHPPYPQVEKARQVWTMDPESSTVEDLNRAINDAFYGDGARQVAQIGLAKLYYAGNQTTRNIKPTLRERLSMWQWRVRDAWLVLTGQADIE